MVYYLQFTQYMFNQSTINNHALQDHVWVKWGPQGEMDSKGAKCPFKDLGL